jgi:hypothetical protein
MDKEIENDADREIINRVLELSRQTFLEDEEIRQFINGETRQEKIRIDREIIEQQKREYEECLEADRKKDLEKKVEEEPDHVPKTREEIRLARLKHFIPK